MVILLQTEMDDGLRSSKKPGILSKLLPGFAKNSPPYQRKTGTADILPTERRPLRSVPYAGPNYRVEPESLVTEFVEKEAKLLGTVQDLDGDFDATDRSSLLKILDEQQAAGLLRHQLSYEDDVILRISVHNFKVLQRDGEKLIQRIVTHKIAAIGYVRDDLDHLIFIKFASELNSKSCNLMILCCDNKTAAEEVCSLSQQVFQLVYTDTAIDFLDKSIMVGAITPKNNSYSTDDSDRKDIVSDELRRSYLQKSAESLSTSNSTSGLGLSGIAKKFNIPDIPPGSSSTLPIPRYARMHRRSGSSGSSGNNVVPTPPNISNSTQQFHAHGEMQIRDYLGVLKEQLTNSELKDFARLLNQFRTGNLKIEDFSNELLEMYTEGRKHLLLGMRHFIPDQTDLSYFNDFLKDNDVDEIPSGSPSSWWAEAPRPAPVLLSELEDNGLSIAENFAAMSSSSSDRASTSIMSNDDSGEYKNLRGNLERLGLHRIAGPSGGTVLDGSLNQANGTPPNATVNLVDSPFLEDSEHDLRVTPVAVVPPPFRDLSDEDSSGTEVGSAGVSKTPSKSSSGGSIKTEKSSEENKSSKPGARVSTSKDMNTISSDKSLKKQDSSLPPSGTKQKEHRKKKKHKKNITTEIAAL